MDRDWRDQQIARLEEELGKLRSQIWTVESDVRQRFWEQDLRRLQLVLGLVVLLAWIFAGLSIADVKIGD